MATSAPNIAFDNTTDAGFRAWGSGISAALSAVGLVQTADTGQINWGTVTHPVAAAVQGYEIWRFSDTLQATKPVFIKIEYGATSSAGQVALFLSVGTATNGAGTLSTLVTGRYVLTTVSSAVAAYASPLYVSGDGSSVNLFTTFSSSPTNAWNWSFGFSIERSRNADGTANGDGLSLFIQQSTGTSQSTSQYLSFTSALVSTANASGLPVPITAARLISYNTGAAVLALPLVVVTPKVQASPLGWLGCGFQDFPRGSTITLTIAGATHTYLCITGSSGAANAKSWDQTTLGILQRWE